jgi:PKD repeat protein
MKTDFLKIFSIILCTILLAAPITCQDLDLGTQLYPKPSIQKNFSIEAASVYYVDGTTGSDSNPGTQALPWKTIQKAATTLRAGDTVNVNAGTYNERVNVTNYSGSSGSLISFIAQGTVQCQGFRITRNYIQVKGFTVTAIVPGWRQEAYGIYVEGSNCIIEENYAYFCPTTGIGSSAASANCIFRNNRLYRNVLTGFEIDGVNHLIENNEVWGTICYYPPTGWVPTGDANGITYYGSGHIFRGNYIHDISFYDPENLGYSPHIDGFQTFPSGIGPASNILFERNLVILPEFRADKNIRCCAWMLEGASYITIRNNIVIAHNGTETGGGGSHHIKIENNMFIGNIGNLPSNWPMGISLENCPNSTVKNNIIYDQVNYAIYLLGTTYTGLDIGYNCTYNSNGSAPRGSSGAQQPTDKWGVNPQFVNPANRDYHLLSNSPCINAGAAIPDNTRDYELNQRPIGSGWDIGAYEYAGVNPPLSASASASPTSGQVPLIVNFTGTASGGASPYTYSWNFGDGQSSTAQNPSHTYSTASNYTATLTVTDSASATASANVSINVSAGPALSANAGASPTSGQAPLTVNFTGTASGGRSPYTYYWTFGDGQSSNAQNPSHIYSAAGNFTSNLTVTDSASAIASSSVNLSVSSTPSLIASANASPTSGQAPLTANFSGSASGGTSPYTYYWTFGDGQSSNVQSPSHTYSTAGNFTATLSVTDSASRTANATVNITVTAKAPLSAAITASPTSGQIPLTVNFTGNASGGTPPYSYSWNFGDGLSSTAQNPSHTYSIAGTYTATFTVTDSASTAANASVIIVVSNKNPLDPAAQFSANPSQGTPPLQVNFDASASYSPNGNISSYEWDFGDGSRGSGKIVSHIFKNRGKFSVVLRVTDSSMRSGTATGEVVVYTKPTALFTTYFLSGRAPRILGFDASPSSDSGGTIVSYKWSFGDGTSGNGKTVIHTFRKNGSYAVTLTVTNDQGYASEVSKTITVNGSTRERRR